MKSNQKGFGVVELIVVIIVIGLLGGAGWLIYNRRSDNAPAPAATQQESNLRALNKGTFSADREFGSLQAEGYASVTETTEAFCTEDCAKHNYVFFNITRSENTDIFTYIKGSDGNSFVADGAIGMGCLADGQISYSNDSDANGSVGYKLSKDDTAAIMAATADKPIALDIERLQLTGGKDAPACYSHFTTFKLLK